MNTVHNMFYTQAEIDSMTWADKAMFTIHSIFYNISESILCFFEGWGD